MTLMAFESDSIFVVEAVLCIAGCLALSLVSTHYMPGTTQHLVITKSFCGDCQMSPWAGVRGIDIPLAELH